MPNEFGTTSACAENTVEISSMIGGVWNYLRVRGEYMFKNFTQPSGVELPPRARRIRTLSHSPPFSQGTTSACAENTVNLFMRIVYPGNYLRVRGEYKSA